MRPLVLVPLAVMLTGCGQTVNTNPMFTHSTAPAASPAASAPAPAPASSSAAGSGSAQNLKVTDDLRAQLIAAGAKDRKLTPADFTGLRPGATYYALDPTTQTYWAGAALVPNPSSQQALVTSQDDGAYTLFHKTASGDWTATNVGMADAAGASGPAGCGVGLPDSVVSLWGWPAGTCHPPK